MSPRKCRLGEVYHRTSGAPQPNGILYGGHYLACEDLDLPLVVSGGPEDNSIHTLFQGEPRERLDPPRWRALEGTLIYGADAARDVVHPADLPWLPSSSFSAFVDPSVHLREPSQRRVAVRGHPAVREPPYEVEHLRPVGADPDPYVMNRVRAWPHALQGIELAVEAQRALFAPHQAHNLDCFFDGADGLPGTPSRAAHTCHGVPESPGPEPHLHPPCREHVEAGGRFRQHGRRPEREVGHVGEEAYVFGHGHERRDKRPGIQKASLVGVVLNTHQVESGSVCGLRDARRPVGRVCERLHAHAELGFPAVVAHVVSFAVVLLSPSAATSEMRRARARTRKASEYAAASSA